MPPVIDGQREDGMPKSLATRIVFCVVTSGMGVLFILEYARVLPWRHPYNCRAVFCDPYHWQILAFGICFFCMGLNFIIPTRMRELSSWNKSFVITALIAGLVGSLFFAK